MGRLNTNDNFAFGQNFNKLPSTLKKNPMVEFRSKMDDLRRRYELNNPLVHSTPVASVSPMIRTSHEINLPQNANQYSKHGKAWFS